MDGGFVCGMSTGDGLGVNADGRWPVSIGTDMGTSGVKAILVDARGNVRAAPARSFAASNLDLKVEKEGEP